jgi:transposase
LRTIRCMDRAALEQMLGEGLSLAEIGRRVGRHEATVAYWLKRHGLRAANSQKHAAKGQLERSQLASLVKQGRSTTQIAEAVGRSKGCVRHWLREYGLTTVWAERRQALCAGRRAMTLRCPRHGMTIFRATGKGGYRCAKCNVEAVSRRRRKVKRTLVAEAGGRCVLCGYDRCVAALEFHHLDRTDKRFSLSSRGVARALTRAREEARKGVLLCANCHAEVEAGATTLAGRDWPALQSVPSPEDHPG